MGYPVLKDIRDVVAEVSPQLAGTVGVTPDDQCEKVDLSILPPEACTPPVFAEARIVLRNLSERKNGLPTVRFMHFEVQTSGEVRVLFYTLDEEHKYQEPFDLMSSARRHYEDTIVRFLEKALHRVIGLWNCRARRPI